VDPELATMSPDGAATDSILERRPEEKENLPSATRAIRLESDLDRALEEIAKQENQSVSLIINKALLRYVEWEYPAGRFGLMTVSSSVMRKLFHLLTVDQARTFGREAGAQFFSEFVNFWFKALDFNALLKALEYLGDQYARAFHFEHSFDGKVHTIIMKHDRGPATSAYYAEALKALLDRLGLKGETVESDQQVTISVQS
jgi:hypothetical protein